MAKKKEPTIQVWPFTQSQILLLQEQARQHANELTPFQTYQSRARNDLLNSFREELGIPEGVPLNVDLNTLQFTERGDDVVPMTTPETDSPEGA